MKKLVVFIITFLLFIGNVFAYDFEIKSDKVIMVNLNEDMILYHKNENEKTQIASLTKIITAITVIENVDDLNQKVKITSNMLVGLDGYAKAGYKVGDEPTYFELLYALMLPSAADAGQALAIATAGSIDNFASMMNDKIKEIGVKNSHFSNPVGMDDDDNYSTANDLYVILKYALKNEKFKAIYEAKEYYAQELGKTIYKTLSQTAKQKNIDISIIKGAKTGFTYDAGLCLATTSSENNVDYLIVVLNADVDSIDHIEDTVNLYNYYIDNYEYKDVVNKDDLLITLPVKKSKTKELTFYASEDVSKYLKKDFDKSKIEIKYTGVDEITSKIKIGDKIGTFDFIYDGELLYQLDIYLNEDIKYYNYMVNIVILILIIVICLLVLKLFIKYIKIKKRRKKKLKMV